MSKTFLIQLHCVIGKNERKLLDDWTQTERIYNFIGLRQLFLIQNSFQINAIF